jgi:Zn-dependent peptidase ImmA (M78 family)
MSPKLNPSRLSLARRTRGVTKKALAEGTGVGIRTVTAYESGEIEASREYVARLAEWLKFPESFFSGDDLSEPQPDGASFRSLSRLTSRDLHSALASGALGFALFDWIQTIFNTPEVDIPNLSGVTNAEAGAETVRALWGLGTKPIPNMVHLLESKGVAVLSLSVAREVDAFSVWKSERPFVFLNTKKSAEHSRMDAAHELAHLVLHRHQKKDGKGDAEREAKDFASAFLMPRADIIASARRCPSLKGVIHDKKRWGVSAIGYVVRLARLGLISEWHYRQLCMQTPRVEEPEPMPRERSKLLEQVLAQLRSGGMTRRQVAEELRLPLQDLNALMFGLVLTQLEGGGAGGASGRPNLRLVDSE